MSISYCEFCDKHIDTDLEAEHFETENVFFKCVEEERAFKEGNDVCESCGVSNESVVYTDNYYLCSKCEVEKDV